MKYVLIFLTIFSLLSCSNKKETERKNAAVEFRTNNGIVFTALEPNANVSDFVIQNPNNIILIMGPGISQGGDVILSASYYTSKSMDTITFYSQSGVIRNKVYALDKKSGKPYELFSFKSFGEWKLDY